MNRSSTSVPSCSYEVPENMNSVIGECSSLLKKHPYTEKFYNRLWKAIFFGTHRW